MDKQLILSVAGSGKTTFIVNELCLEKKSLIITYTDNNYVNMRNKIIKKFGFFPDNVCVMSYFKFLYSFCYKPFLDNIVMAKGYNYKTPPFSTLKMKRSNPNYYIDSNRCLYHNRVAKLIEVQGGIEKVGSRIEKYFDEFYVDEVQDFGGHDFNLLLGISNIESRVIFVGDFFQHTFDTSRDGSVNKNLHEDLTKYMKRYTAEGFKINNSLLSKSHRCSKTICEFITNNIGIDIESHNEKETKIELVDDQARIQEIMENENIIKLFYQSSKRYKCLSLNWGESKGLDQYSDVCVILNKGTYKLFNENKLGDMNVRTRNKFYVACSRARNKLIFMPEKLIKEYKN